MTLLGFGMITRAYSRITPNRTRIGLYSQSARSEDGFDEPKGFISGKEPFG
jgi:hypothetical protein